LPAQVHLDTSGSDVVLGVANFAHCYALQLPFFVALGANPRAVPVIDTVNVFWLPSWLLWIVVPGQALFSRGACEMIARARHTTSVDASASRAAHD
jgi:hypothetical protein